MNLSELCADTPLSFQLEHFVTHHSWSYGGSVARTAMIKKMADEVDPEAEAAEQAKESEAALAYDSSDGGY